MRTHTNANTTPESRLKQTANKGVVREDWSIKWDSPVESSSGGGSCARFAIQGKRACSLLNTRAEKEDKLSFLTSAAFKNVVFNQTATWIAQAARAAVDRRKKARVSTALAKAREFSSGATPQLDIPHPPQHVLALLWLPDETAPKELIGVCVCVCVGVRVCGCAWV
jgi:hypothetical protein